MTEENGNHRVDIVSSASLDDIERLVSGIERQLIIDMVKHLMYLQRLFRGFRPTHLPWSRVPKVLARDAHGDMGKLAVLLDMWLSTNEELCQKVAEDINPETVEDDLVDLLITLGIEERDRVLWALLLDEREDIKMALANGLKDKLTHESSSFMNQAKSRQLVKELEGYRQENADLKSQMNDLEAEKKGIEQHLCEEAEYSEQLEDTLQRIQESFAQSESQRNAVIRQRDTVEQEISLLKTELEHERSQGSKLQKDIDELKSKLEESIASHSEIVNETEKKINENLVILEELRKQNAQLQLYVSRIEKERDTAYTKRDEEQKRSEALSAQIEQMKHDKQVLIDQIRKQNLRLAQLENMKTELNESRETIAAMRKEREKMIELACIDQTWAKAVETLSCHIASLLPEYETNSKPIQSHSRWSDWQNWQEMEAAWVKPLLDLRKPASGESLVDMERTQRILMLRWYLLEWLKLVINETLRESNLAFRQTMSEDGDK